MKKLSEMDKGLKYEEMEGVIEFTLCINESQIWRVISQNTFNFLGLERKNEGDRECIWRMAVGLAEDPAAAISIILLAVSLHECPVCKAQWKGQIYA